MPGLQHAHSTEDSVWQGPQGLRDRGHHGWASVSWLGLLGDWLCALGTWSGQPDPEACEVTQAVGWPPLIRVRKPESLLLRALASLFQNPFMEPANDFGFLEEFFALQEGKMGQKIRGGTGDERRSRGREEELTFVGWIPQAARSRVAGNVQERD